ncbi:GBS Bsp-like repeat-containing protein [Streptococcus suis]|uniref:GBS Bsp-like repeat-containing protein n=1 Tax=Streptococcus suis TaxID=1307 RepID=UPI000CF384C6|nr:GBS Bsp-like repeat-containing protein [Streptococcus suis]
MRRTRFGQEKQSFSIRKYSLGAASVLIGTSLVFGLQDVKADEQVGTAASSNLSLVQVGESNQAVQLKSEPAQLVDETQKVASQTEGQASGVESSHTLTSESQVSPVASSQEKPSTTTSQEPSPQETSVVEATRTLPVTVTSPPAQASTPTGQLTIQNQTSTGFDIEVSNVSDSQGIKAVKVPVWSEQEGQNDIVWYDAVRQANGNYKVSVSLTTHKNEQGVYHAHLYYVENDGKLVGVTTTQTKASVAGSSQATQVEKLADQGTYHFTKQVAVKNEAKEGAITQFTFEKGEKVNYDKKIESDGHQWISYLSYSGVRRYVDLGKVSSSVQSVAGQPVTTQTSTPTGQLTIQNQTSTGFDIEISNVSDSQGIKAVKVPVWSEQEGQNDIVWYDAVRQANGNYKVSVSLTTHKNEQGVYHAHLYYVENDGKLVGVTTTQTKASVAGSSQATQVEKLADQGTYHFTKQVAVKNEAKEGAITQFTFEKGEKVNYDKKIESDGHQWISYLSYSGVRRYVKIDN